MKRLGELVQSIKGDASREKERLAKSSMMGGDSRQGQTTAEDGAAKGQSHIMDPPAPSEGRQACPSPRQLRSCYSWTAARDRSPSCPPRWRRRGRG